MKLAQSMPLLSLVFVAAISTNPARASEIFKATDATDELVACRMLVAQERWQHIHWPVENVAAKPSTPPGLDEAELRADVDETARMQNALFGRYGARIGGTELQAELDRVSRDTRAPGRLKNLAAILDGRADRVAQCLLMPRLVEQRLRTAFASDESVHGQTREAAILDLATEEAVDGAVSASVGRVTYVKGHAGADPSQLDAITSDGQTVALAPEQWQYKLDRLRGQANASIEGSLVETADAFVRESLTTADGVRFETQTRTWPKQTFDDWWAGESSHWSADIETLDAHLHMPDRITGVVAGKSVDSPLDAPDSWRALSTVGAPAPRLRHVAVWTGTEMLVFGGTDDSVIFGNGGRYDVLTDSWLPMSLVNVPSPRTNHRGIWTGTELVVWGGYGGSGSGKSDGGRYDPITDMWTSMSTVTAPAGRSSHSAVWTGSEMIVFGGCSYYTCESFLASVGRYSPELDAWLPMSATGAPAARINHSGVFAAGRMVIWGGNTTSQNSVNTGARYDPLLDEWSSVSLQDAPSSRIAHVAISSGPEMFIWGGDNNGNTYYNTGAIYDPSVDVWTPMSTVGAVAGKTVARGVWTGFELIVWGGWGSAFDSTGGSYDPQTDSWKPTSLVGAPMKRRNHSTVWTGDEMLVWGGRNTVYQIEPLSEGGTVQASLASGHAYTPHMHENGLNDVIFEHDFELQPDP
jgi:hypothetical protein